MSEGNVPSHSHDANSIDASAPTAPRQASTPPRSDDWEVVPLSGIPPVAANPAIASPSAAQISTNRVTELQSRVLDLNQCNEVLLARVNQLEEALERSQQTLQQEVERSQRLTPDDKVTAAQTQSVAQLLSELEQTHGALERQTILAETLSTQLQTHQARSQQLEQDCVILRQEKTERVQQLQTAEATCADLRSRLQRQQRYTLQFKAALEKCLDTSAFGHTAHGIEQENITENIAASQSAAVLDPAIMPRSERIQPWSAGTTPAQADPQLLSLMRGKSTPTTEPPLPTDSDTSPAITDFSPPLPTLSEPAPPSEPASATASDAENQLWQDVERVISNPTPGTSGDTLPTVDTAAAAAANSQPSAIPTPPKAVQFTEPIPWGSPAPAATPTELEPAATTLTPREVAENLKAALENTSAASNAESSFSSGAAGQPSVPAPRASVSPQPSPFATTIPALEAMNSPQASPSPIVHPLRPTQRKRKSLSAVELPSFPPLPKVKQD
ncbi:MAG: hypothetical protein AAGH67_04840 [Cyanobacteria bacterium P01_H01_bin.162]